MTRSWRVCVDNSGLTHRALLRRKSEEFWKSTPHVRLLNPGRSTGRFDRAQAVVIHLVGCPPSERGQYLAGRRAVEDRIGRVFEFRFRIISGSVSNPFIEPVVRGTPMKEIVIVRKIRSKKPNLFSGAICGVLVLTFLKDLARPVFVMRRIGCADIHVRKANQQRLRREGRQKITAIEP